MDKKIEEFINVVKKNFQLTSKYILEGVSKDLIKEIKDNNKLLTKDGLASFENHPESSFFNEIQIKSIALGVAFNNYEIGLITKVELDLVVEDYNKKGIDWIAHLQLLK